jgi:hypothetical protein
MYASFTGWSAEEMRMIEAPLMVMLGDRDSLRLEHAIELYRMVPEARLAVLPASDYGAPIARADWLAPMLVDFFEED